MFALYPTKKFGIVSLSDNTVLYHCSGQSDETHLHPIHKQNILQNIHKNMKKRWVLSISGRMSLQGSKWNLLCYLLLILIRSVLVLSQVLLRDPSESPQNDQVTSSCSAYVRGGLSPLYFFPLSFELLSCILFKLYNETLHLLYPAIK